MEKDQIQIGPIGLFKISWIYGFNLCDASSTWSNLFYNLLIPLHNLWMDCKSMVVLDLHNLQSIYKTKTYL